ncbi:DUF6377 domain-containing protein [Chitinophaga sp. Cy-1792]|uniref:DUF6377 domain-containing protein n=1 Tax=Chitinophaga sp. Cy-1792 TaxID=2608339 RepID=UPI001422B631|nr:DUF6377 domain-containing protein [Chitinophaga sp. Cy-1792]NIG54869.1 hypothetical protein [Chitinophaga sp. Cy-1792]
MNKKLFTILLLLIFADVHARSIPSDSAFQLLKSELSKEHIYDKAKEKRIARLQQTLQHTGSSEAETRFHLYSDIFGEYSYFKFDSAYVYVNKMIATATQSGNRDELIKSKILLGKTLLCTGFYKEGFDVANNIDTTTLTTTLKTDYLLLRARLNTGIGDYDNDAYFSQDYYRQAADDFRRAETHTPSSEFEKIIDLAFLPDAVKSQHLTTDYFLRHLTSSGLTPHHIAMAATRLSFAFTDDNRLLFLAIAAIHDIRSSTKETLAIFLLGQELFKAGKTEAAYTCMQVAARNASFYGARNRAAQIETMLPLVAAKLLDEKQHQHDRLLIGMLLFSMIAVVLFFLLVIYRRQLRCIKANEQTIKEKNSELEMVNEKLWASTKIKEELIGLFFKTCSTYIDTLDRLKREGQHRIKLAKYNDISQLLKNIPVDQEKGNLYHMLDTVFLTMLPNFIHSFNALLKKEDQIWPKSGETLNATLRIFALMRLGITENETIAKILDYSVSTVYTYKTRIKSRALVPAADFDQKIMEIKFMDGQGGV